MKHEQLYDYSTDNNHRHQLGQRLQQQQHDHD
jgi:hypothetical protein